MDEHRGGETLQKKVLGELVRTSTLVYEGLILTL